MEEGLSYRYHASWPFVLQALGAFYRVAGKRAHPVMIKVQWTQTGLWIVKSCFRSGVLVGD